MRCAPRRRVNRFLTFELLWLAHQVLGHVMEEVELVRGDGVEELVVQGWRTSVEAAGPARRRRTLLLGVRRGLRHGGHGQVTLDRARYEPGPAELEPSSNTQRETTKTLFAQAKARLFGLRRSP